MNSWERMQKIWYVRAGQTEVLSEPCTCCRVRLWDVHISKDPGTSAAQSSQIKRHTCTHTHCTQACVLPGQWTGVNDSASKIACDTKKLLALKEGMAILSTCTKHRAGLVQSNCNYSISILIDHWYGWREKQREFVFYSQLLFTVTEHGRRLLRPHCCTSESPQTASSALWNSPLCDVRRTKTPAPFWFDFDEFSVCALYSE